MMSQLLPITTRFGLTVLLVFVLFNRSNAQFLQPKEDYENGNYLQNRAVLYANGDTPFSENGKWGMRNVKGETVLPPVYDSILNGGYNFCIGVKDGKYELFNVHYQSCFDVPMKEIFYSSSSFLTTTFLGYESGCFVDGEWLTPATNRRSHLKANVQRKEKEVKKYQFYENFKGSAISSVSWPIESKSKTNVEFRLKSGKEINIPTSHCKGVMDDRYLWITNDEKVTSIVDLRTWDTVLKLPAREGTLFIRTFEDLGQNYFECHYVSPYKTIIAKTSGEIVLNSENNIYKYEGGLLLKAIQPVPSYPYTYEAYRFPDLVKVGGEFCDIQSDGNFMFIDNCKKGEYELYFRDSLLQTWKFTKEKEIFFTGEHLDHEDPVYVSVNHNRNEKGSEITVFAMDGSMVYKSGYLKGNKSVSLISNLGGAIVLNTNKNDEYYDLTAFNYDLKTKKKQTITGDFYDQLSSTIFKFDGDDYGYYGDSKGSMLKNSKFTESEILELDSARFVSIIYNGKSRICNDKLEVFCESCNFAEDLAPRPNRPLPSWFMMIYYTKENVYRVFDSKGKLLLPDAYPAIFYHEAAGNFVALTKTGEIVYIPFTKP